MSSAMPPPIAVKIQTRPSGSTLAGMTARVTIVHSGSCVLSIATRSPATRFHNVRCSSSSAG
jgi:hypothetical protein